MAGSFGTLAGEGCTNDGRLNLDGSLDSSFRPNGVGFVNCMAGQADGKLLLAALLTTADKPSTNNLIRLNADGTLDTTFNPQIFAPVSSLAVQADGKILVSGQFSSLGGGAVHNVGRLNPGRLIGLHF